MGTNNETVEAPLVDLLIFLSTISNVWLICVIFYKKLHWQSGYLLLLHLAGNKITGFKIKQLDCIPMHNYNPRGCILLNYQLILVSTNIL